MSNDYFWLVELYGWKKIKEEKYDKSTVLQRH